MSLPRPLHPEDNVQDFGCGQADLDDWLKHKALSNERSGASRTYVVSDNDRVVAYYCLATGSILRTDAPSKVRRNMPDPIPVMVLGRLAVDQEHQKRGIGTALVKDAVLRTLQVAEQVGIRAILVQAIDESAKKFYVEKCGFKPSPIDSFTLMVTLGDIKKSIGLSS